MAILDIDVSSAQAPEPVEPGERELRVIDVRQGEDKNGNPYVMPRFEVVDDDLAPDFTDFLALPTKDMREQDPKRFKRAEFRLQQFALAFGLDPSNLGDPEADWKGMTGWALLGIEQSDQFGDRNSVKKYTVGA